MKSEESLIDKLNQNFLNRSFNYNSSTYEIIKTPNFISGESFFVSKDSVKKYFWKRKPTRGEVNCNRYYLNNIPNTVKILEIDDRNIIFEYVDFNDELTKDNFHLLYDWIVDKNSNSSNEINKISGLKFDKFEICFSNIALDVIREKFEKKVVEQLDSNRSQLIAGIEMIRKLPLKLQHTDLHRENVLFKDSEQDFVVIDWGLAVKGSGISDLVMSLREYGQFFDKVDREKEMSHYKADYAKKLKLDNFDHLYWTVDVCRSIQDINYFVTRPDLFEFLPYLIDQYSTNIN